MNQEAIDANFKHLESRLDSQEELIANLMLAYTEMSSAIETVINTVLEPKDEQEKAEFRKALQQRHIDTIAVMREVYESVNKNEVDESTSGDSGTAILRMAAEKHVNRNDE